jgi:putative ABC transport system ATP-binding protein
MTERERVGELRANHLTFAAAGAAILDRLDLVAVGGRWLTIAGPTGSGKSLLLHLLGGLLRPTSGEILIDDVAAWDPPGRHPQPALVLQDYNLLPVLTAAETVAVPLQARGVAKAEIRARCTEWLGTLGLAAASDQLVTQLSGGQRQRVAIARALAMQSPIVLLDEPTAELDAANRDNVLGLLRGQAEAGAVVVVVSHDPAVLEASDTITTLGDGPHPAAG